jgi:quercetin dioxygenase-like cupin family protein
MTMSKMKWKLMLAGVVVACAFGGTALRFAWATDGGGVGSTLIAGPVLLDEIDIKDVNDTHEKVKIRTKGLWTSRIVHFHIAPGGHTGWHSHPGPVFVMIKAGTMTLEQSDGSSAVYPPGTGFTEDPYRVHIARNEGDVDLEFDAFILIPLGAPVRIDEDAPAP